MAMASVPSLRSWIETLLPWYQPDVERQRDQRTTQIERRSQIARARAERVIAEYRLAEVATGLARNGMTKAAAVVKKAEGDLHEAGEALVDEAREE